MKIFARGAGVFLTVVIMLASCSTTSHSRGPGEHEEAERPYRLTTGSVPIPDTPVEVSFTNTPVRVEDNGVSARVGSCELFVAAALTEDNFFVTRDGEELLGEPVFSSGRGAIWSSIKTGEKEIITARTTLMSSEGTYNFTLTLLGKSIGSGDLWEASKVLGSARINMERASQKSLPKSWTLPSGYEWIPSRHDQNRYVFFTTVTDKEVGDVTYTLTVDRFRYPGINRQDDERGLLAMLASKGFPQYGIETLDFSPLTSKTGGRIGMDYAFGKFGTIYHSRSVGYWSGSWLIFAELRIKNEESHAEVFERAFDVLGEVQFHGPEK